MLILGLPLFPFESAAFVVVLGAGLPRCRKALHLVADNFRGVPVLAGLVLPFAGADAPFDENQLALFQIPCGDIAGRAKQGDPVPLGFLAGFARGLVLVGLGRGDSQICDAFAFCGVADFGVAPQSAYQLHFVQHESVPFVTHFRSLRCSERWRKPASF